MQVPGTEHRHRGTGENTRTGRDEADDWIISGYDETSVP